MKRQPPEFAISSRNIVTKENIRPAAILIKDGVIQEIISPDQIPGHYPIENVGEAYVLPGVVDTHVHINEPGRTRWEGFETATRAAAAGGITTLVDMPLNSSPVTTTPQALQKKLKAAKNKLWVDCGFYGGLIPGNTEQIDPLLCAGVLGIKAFLIHSGIEDFPNVSDTELRMAMPVLANNKMPLLVHAEIFSNHSFKNGQTENHFPGKNENEDARCYQAYLRSRPNTWENRAIHRMIRMAKEYRCPVHIVHLSSSDTLPALSEARQNSVKITVETCPHYLFFAAEDIADGDTRFKCAPPIRETENREKLWQGLKDGIIDFIASDHSPCPPEMKLPHQGDFLQAWGGISSLQFSLPVVWTAAHRRGFSIQEVVKWLCRRPAEVMGLGNHKGAIAAGFDADLIVFHPDKRLTVQASMNHHRHKITPYEGHSLLGFVEKTYLRGQKIYDGGQFGEKPAGKVLLRKN
jgi:allantoinase